MKKPEIIFIIILNINFCFSQITGRCIDTSGKPLVYVNIALKNTMHGTVTNTDGYFTIDNNSLDEKKNPLVISHIGYITKFILVANKTENEIVMEEVDLELDEVSIVMSKFTKEKRIGNNKLSENVVVGFNSRILGTETGKFFKVPKGKKYRIEKIHFNVQKLGYKKATFRINFYNANSNEDIEKVRCNSKDIIMEVSNKGDVDIDVKNENLLFENSFLVAIEWVGFVEKTTEVPAEKIIFFSSNVFSGPYYFRSNNLMKWASIKSKYNVGLGFQLFVKY